VLAFVWGLVRGNQAGWGSAEVVVSLAVAVLLVAAFVVAGVGVSMAIPAAQNSVIGALGNDAIGKAAGVNSMMRELGGVFGIAVVVAVFAATGSYASAAAFTNGFAPGIGVAAGLALAGAFAGLALPGRRRAADAAPEWAGATAEAGG
jgi:hypothetical protein